MAGLSLTKFRGGSAIVTYRGSTFYSRDDILFDHGNEVFPLRTDVYGEIQHRISRKIARISFTPAGKWGDLSVLYPFANMLPGDLSTPVRTLGTIIANVVGCSNHRLLPGDAVYVGTLGGTLPTGLIAQTLYYIHPASSDAVTFHTNRADALVGTNPISVSGGSGTNQLVVNNPLTIQTKDGVLYTFPNAALIRSPDIVGTSRATLLEQCVFEAYPIDGNAPETANSYYTVSAVAWPGDTSFAASQLLTQGLSIAWGSSPWDAFQAKGPVRISFAHQFEPWDVDASGVLTQRLVDVTVSARFQPVGGISEASLQTALKIQGAGAALGSSLAGANLEFSATGFFLRLYGAQLESGPEHFSGRSDRIGEMLWTASRTFDGLGNPLPLYYLATASPIS